MRRKQKTRKGIFQILFGIYVGKINRNVYVIYKSLWWSVKVSHCMQISLDCIVFKVFYGCQRIIIFLWWGMCPWQKMVAVIDIDDRKLKWHHLILKAFSILLLWVLFFCDLLLFLYWGIWMCIVYTLFLNEDYNCICIPLSYVKFQTCPLYEIVN